MGGFSSLRVQGAPVAADRTVTQSISVTTGVTINSHAGQIVTVTQTAVTDDQDTFTVTNSAVQGTDDVILISIGAYGGTLGTNGNPLVTVTAVAAGSFNVTIGNYDTTALSGTLTLNFVVINVGPNPLA